MPARGTGGAPAWQHGGPREPAEVGAGNPFEAARRVVPWVSPRNPREGNTVSPAPQQPVTDDSIQVRQLSHYQFSWVAGEPGKPGTWTLQLVLDQGAWEEVLTIDADDADNLQDLLSTAKTVYYDVRRQTLMFGTVAPGAH